MTTKQLIKLLKEADPSGESHIRMDGGIPLYVISKPGYWDGPYSYIDEFGNWVESKQGTKVDIYTLDIWDFVEGKLDDNPNITFEEIKQMIKFDMGNSKTYKELRVDPLLDKAKAAYDEIKEIEDKIYQKSLEDMIENAKKGWTWFQDKRIDSDDPSMHYYYTWKIYDENLEEQGSCVNNTQSIQKSGLWERLDNGVKSGYYQWIFKN